MHMIIKMDHWYLHIMIIQVFTLAIVTGGVSTSEDDEAYLENFDRIIIQELKYPIASNGQKLYQYMLRYYSDLLDLLNMLVSAGNVKVKRYVRTLIDNGGPKIFLYPYNLTQLETIFNWTKGEVDVFNSAFSKARSLWRKIQNTTVVGEDIKNNSEEYSYGEDSEKDDYAWTESKIKT